MLYCVLLYCIALHFIAVCLKYASVLVTKQDVRELMREVRSTSRAGELFRETLETCDVDCLAPLGALRILQPLLLRCSRDVSMSIAYI